MLILVTEDAGCDELFINRFKLHLSVEEMLTKVLGIQICRNNISIVSTEKLTKKEILCITKLWCLHEDDRNIYLAWVDNNYLRFAADKDKEDGIWSELIQQINEIHQLDIRL